MAPLCHVWGEIKGKQGESFSIIISTDAIFPVCMQQASAFPESHVGAHKMSFVKIGSQRFAWYGHTVLGQAEILEAKVAEKDDDRLAG